MKRDMDIIRTILLGAEAQTQKDFGSTFSVSGVSEEQIEIHLPLLIDKGLLEGKDWSSMKSRSWGMVRLTWDGHDFLDTVRDDEIWRETKNGVKAAGGFSLDLIKSLAKGLVKQKIEKHTGVELEL